MKKFNKFTDEASYTSFIQNIAEPGYYTSWVVGNLNKGDDIYSDGTNFYNYAKEGTELIGKYCGKINDTYYLKAPAAIYRGYFLTLDGYKPTAAYPENISSYNSYNNIPYNVYRGREFNTGETSYPGDYRVYGVTDVKETVSWGNKISKWEGYWLNNYNPGTTSYHYTSGNGTMCRCEAWGSFIEVIPDNISWDVTYPKEKWYTEENYRAWAIEKLILYRDNMVDNWEIPSNKLNLGNDVFYYETAALLNEIKDLIPVLPFLTDLDLGQFHYDYLPEVIHIYSDNTIVIEEQTSLFVIDVIADKNKNYEFVITIGDEYMDKIFSRNSSGYFLGSTNFVFGAPNMTIYNLNNKLLASQGNSASTIGEDDATMLTDYTNNDPNNTYGTFYVDGKSINTKSVCQIGMKYNYLRFSGTVSEAKTFTEKARLFFGRELYKFDRIGVGTSLIYYNHVGKIGKNKIAIN